MSPEDMPRPNVQVFREALEAFNRRDKEAFLALTDPEVENFSPRDWPESHPVQGAEAVWDFFVANNEPWEDSPLEPVEVIDTGGDIVVAHLRGQMHGRVSGADVPWGFWQVISVPGRPRVAHLLVRRPGRGVRTGWGLRHEPRPSRTSPPSSAASTPGTRSTSRLSWLCGTPTPNGARRSPKGTEGTGGVFRGHEGLRQAWSSVRVAWSEYRVDPESVRVVGEEILVLGRIFARGKTSDVAIDSEWSAVVRFRDGLAVSAWDWLDHRSALDAVERRRMTR